MKNESDKKRYLLYGSAGPWSDYIIEFDDLTQLKLEAITRIKAGYTAGYIDRQTNEDHSLRLPE